MSKKTAYEFEVTSEDGDILIQRSVSLGHEKEMIVIHPDQVDLLIRWLQEERASLQQSQKE